MHLIYSLKESSVDVRLLWVSVFLRMTSFGLTNQVLTFFLKSLSVSETNIGLFMTLTLVGDTLISYVLTWYADSIGRRVVMLAGAVMMFVSGVIFSYNSHFYILLIAAILGVISPSGDETGPFKSVEEASIAHLTPFSHRPEVFAFHGFFATMGAALGSFVCGVTVDYLNLQHDWDLIDCYRFIFKIYSLIALLKCLIVLFLSSGCEITIGNDLIVESEVTSETTSLMDTSDIHEDENLLNENEDGGLIPTFGLSPAAKYHLSRLLVVFMLDSFGYGFMPAAWVVYYFKTTFTISATGLGTLFFIANAIDSIASLPSAFLAKLLGPVKAMISVQAPSAVFFILIAATSNYLMASVLLILFYATATMDVVPRQVLLTSIIPANELTKVMGIVNIGKTFARCIGPVFTGKLAVHNRLYFGYIINGICVLTADTILGYNFLHLDSEIIERQKII